MGSDKVGSYYTKKDYFNKQERLKMIRESAYDVNACLFTSYLDNLVGISNPNLLNPPSFCPALEAEVDSGEEPVDFLNVFFAKP